MILGGIKFVTFEGSKSYKIAAVLKRKAISYPRVANDDLMPTEWRARKNKKSLETIPF